jgi:Big-like domain-containing protein
MIAAGLATASPAVATEPTDFCEEQVVHDYLQPLKELQEASALPPGSSVYFGHRNLRASTLEPLLVGGGWVGYSLSVKRGVGAGVVHLGWRVKTELSRINRFGDEVESIRVWRRQIGVLSDRNATGVRFKLGNEPGLYRLLTVIRNGRGKTLGGFGYYARVVAPKADARLVLNASIFGPGQTVLGHVENFGTDRATYGAGLTIERLEGSTWSVAPESPRGPVPAIAYAVLPGMSANRCSSFTVPETMPPGHYRMTLSPELTTEFDLGTTSW